MVRRLTIAIATICAAVVPLSSSAALALPTRDVVADTRVVSSDAGPSDIGIQGCQATGAALHYTYYTSSGTRAIWSKTCSGVYPLNSRGYMLDAGGWSGYMFFAAEPPLRFCNQISYWLPNDRVVGIVMNTTRLPEC
jgi:hypothetical protein